MKRRAVRREAAAITNCWYCGIKLDSNNHSWDHQVPLAKFGSSSDSNLVRSCRRCNNEKGSLTVEEYRAHLQSRMPWSLEFYGENEERPIFVETAKQPNDAMFLAMQKAGLVQLQA